MPIYVYKGGSDRIINGILLRNKGDEIELDSLTGIVNANRFILKKEKPIPKTKKVIPEIVKEVPIVEKVEKKIEPEVKIKGGNN